VYDEGASSTGTARYRPAQAIRLKHASRENFLFTASRTKAGRKLPPYYLVYFLLVDLPEFTNLAQFEKVAWSVPVDLYSVEYLIAYRKLSA
jgi:hypothetical protein